MLAMRNQWAAYMDTAVTASGSTHTPSFNLMGEGFTDLSESKNPTEYSRKYIHEQSERTDVTGFAPAMAYSMDYYTSDPVCMCIREITDQEKIGSDAQRDIVLVDLFDPDTGTEGSYKAYKRRFAIIPDGKGSGTDALIYTGNLKAAGDIIKGKFAVSTKTFTSDAEASDS